MGLDDPIFGVNALKLQEGWAQCLGVVERPHPKPGFIEVPHKTLGALPLPSGAPTRARVLTIPRQAIADCPSWDINNLAGSCPRVKPGAAWGAKAPKDSFTPAFIGSRG
jgi:hypothetical protein